MRSRKAFLNTITSLMLEVLVILNGFIVPRLILSTFGSSYLGITSSIGQFLGYISLLTTGIAGVTRAALYKPLAENDTRSISAIVKATEIFLRKIALIFIGALLVFASLYPFLKSVKFDENQFSWLFSFTLVIIIGSSTFFQYFFGITYVTVLVADQKLYIDSLIRIAATLANTVTAVLLIKAGASIHLVRLGGSIFFIISPIAIHFYVKHKYKIIKNIKPNNSAVKQRWDAFAHQIAGFIHSNTDLVILSFFSTLKEVSVFSIYNMISIGMYSLVTSVFRSIESAFGDMIAKGESYTLKKNLSMFEFLAHYIAITLFVTMALLITPFVLLYTKGITDVNYNRALFGYLISAAGFFYIVRYPCHSIATAAGHYRQTRNGAIFEATLNISISLVLIKPLGIIGIMIGTLAAMIYRTLHYTWYVYKNVVEQSFLPAIIRYLSSALNIVVIIGIVILIKLPLPNNYFEWAINGIIVFSISLVVTTIFSLIFQKEDFFNFIQFLKNLSKQRTLIFSRFWHKKKL